MARKQAADNAPKANADGEATETAQQPTSLPNNRFKIQLLPGHTEDLTAVTFQITDEDHTLGNALRYVITKNPDVEFCGYSIPHPSEPKLNMRIQTYEGDSGKTAVDALEKGLDDLMAICGVIEDKFRGATEEHQNQMDTD